MLASNHIIGLCHELHEIQPAGGNLHVVLDEPNYENDETIQWCLDIPYEQYVERDAKYGYHPDVTKRHYELVQVIGKAMLLMPVSERAILVENDYNGPHWMRLVPRNYCRADGWDGALECERLVIAKHQAFSGGDEYAVISLIDERAKLLKSAPRPEWQDFMNGLDSDLWQAFDGTEIRSTSQFISQSDIDSGYVMAAISTAKQTPDYEALLMLCRDKHIDESELLGIALTRSFTYAHLGYAATSGKFYRHYYTAKVFSETEYESEFGVNCTEE